MRTRDLTSGGEQPADHKPGVWAASRGEIFVSWCDVMMSLRMLRGLVTTGKGSHCTVSFVCTHHMMYGVCDVPSPVSDPCPISGVRLKCLQNLVLMPIYCITARII